MRKTYIHTYVYEALGRRPAPSPTHTYAQCSSFCPSRKPMPPHRQDSGHTGIFPWWVALIDRVAAQRSPALLSRKPGRLTTAPASPLRPDRRLATVTYLASPWLSRSAAPALPTRATQRKTRTFPAPQAVLRGGVEQTSPPPIAVTSHLVVGGSTTGGELPAASTSLL
jgi:hypothetical protein